MEIKKELISESIKFGLSDILRQGLPKSCLEKIVKVARPMGELVYIANKLGIGDDDYDEFFSQTRKSGIDGSVEYAYGGSTVPSINGISPYVSPADVYMQMLDLPYSSKEDDDEKKEDIFYAGHQVEPVLRNYFRRMYGDRYIVVNTDMMWQSRKWTHYVMNIDGLLYDKETGQLGILEIKHTSHRNIGTIKSFVDENVPAHYDAQGRSYVEGFDAEFCEFFLGWGLRPDTDCTARVRVDRNKAIGASLLDVCEAFVSHNVEKNIAPSFHSVKDRNLIKKCIEEIYGKVDHYEPPFEFDESMKDAFDSLLKKKEAYDEAKKKETAAKKETEKALGEYEELQLPFIEAMKTAPYGYITDNDGKRHTIAYDTRKAVDVNLLMRKFPDVYEAVKKPAISTPELKKVSPEAYKECFLPTDGKRSFKVK